MFVLGWLLPGTGINADLKNAVNMSVVVILVLLTIYFTIDRKVYRDSVLVIDAQPEPGHEFRGKIETPLKAEPSSGCRLLLMLMSGENRSHRAIWRSEAATHPIRDEHGLILPVQFSIPADVAKQLSTRSQWRLTAAANILPLPFRATFSISTAPPTLTPAT